MTQQIETVEPNVLTTSPNAAIAQLSVISRAKWLAEELGKMWDERLELILFFALTKPASWFPSRGKRKIRTATDIDDRYLRGYVSRYYVAREGVVLLKQVGTIRDRAVDEVLKHFAGIPKEKLDEIADAHRLSMQAENIIGSLLERYVARMLENKGWIWCCGETVRSVDFIKHDAMQTKLLQVKNRSNSENSSSSAIRKDTEIIKWFRTYSLTGKTCWDSLPENSSFDNEHYCSEPGFFEFMKSYPTQNTTVVSPDL